jgi:hypothetical protein
MRPPRKITIAAVVITVPLAVGWFFAPRIICHLGDRREELVLATMKGINEAVYELARCPTASEGIGLFVRSGYLVKEPVDPWWGGYEYRTDGHAYSITSFGADGRPGGTGKDADIQRAFRCPSDHRATAG